MADKAAQRIEQKLENSLIYCRKTNQTKK